MQVMEVVQKMLKCARISSNRFWKKNKKDLKQQKDTLKSKVMAGQVNNCINPRIQCRVMAINSSANETTGCCPPRQMAKKHISCLLERHSNK